ncbi:hypothetical protein [Pseudochryseolinea flava]|uniref:Tail fiber domain-containing protein n=1 Tax=Pseudochryseolinea flava TaxID=2059302 RepID=A0A364Y3E2_9BACT|nr:hypothetical protein [Pseudochryseolinea flava]RAW00666.1 hypothetical protein DQQ10_13840 [Pseudochryseolinea flava]
MKNLLIVLIVCGVSSNVCRAQWTTAGVNINYTTGAVSIGTTKVSTPYKLAVGGGIIAEEVVIKLQAAWPDYVFDGGYPLMDLKALDAYISEHKHLPDVPSALEVEREGVKIGEMNTVLLKKIEELTRYVIVLQKQIDEMK